ncbi:mitochondrial ATP synthase epsilon chain-domain-containing protein [Lentinula guzmanii]|uniref:Mitochondrial ATP synthase epsilon chain-domain-containing protein n=4 Tax=Lentinula TaxID=5352 RepID=A0AA38J3I8_9AGAR|nr:mitochondrial ATP synthase epsilon chain-domain-containing protein [Lentinula guzmanii]KAJ3738689.1 mitochondrial ATP synthase epsilon chain-domain-containing protein [Lentinula detonsa]KAJ3782533.1 mitochondrial ATP synthase epsilon chain-domain-containing protein [Lentinula aff. detonsa]KAJ3994501.1 mitochondrial ATP synthase epsilon chain-domain-containing protein [Lentinula boryana]KAJ3743264.1 mitochondrial ATP synthase epsilon chain-domain-containing protein [Lentinula detonsa]
MSAATWRNTFTFNKYSQITAGAVRKSLKETQRLAAEKRGLTALRYQVWENGKGGEQITLDPTQESDPKKKTAAV